jgi:predicted metallopeptidase
VIGGRGSFLSEIEEIADGGSRHHNSRSIVRRVDGMYSSYSQAIDQEQLIISSLLLR